jgi:hypothetical protein
MEEALQQKVGKVLPDYSTSTYHYIGPENSASTASVFWWSCHPLSCPWLRSQVGLVVLCWCVVCVYCRIKIINTSNFSSNLTVNTLRLHCKHETVNAVQRNYRSLLSYGSLTFCHKPGLKSNDTLKAHRHTLLYQNKLHAHTKNVCHHGAKPMLSSEALGLGLQEQRILECVKPNSVILKNQTDTYCGVVVC